MRFRFFAQLLLAFSMIGVAFADPEINVLGNSVLIANGDTTPTTADDTDFGDANYVTGTTTKTFTIKNVGTPENLLLTGSPIVSITAGDFTVSQQPSSTTVAAAGEVTFDVTFNPTDYGDRTATVSISSNDATDSTYTFTVKGTGTNDAPVAVANASDPGVVAGTKVTLSASGSSDPDLTPSPITYSWTQDGGNPAVVTLTDESGDNMQVSFTPTVNGTYSFDLTVSDGMDTDTETVVVKVGDVIVIELDSSATEGDGTIQGTVRASRTLGVSETVTVTLSSSDETEVRVDPSLSTATVTIPASSSSATFSLYVQDDALDDDTQTVTITGAATGWLNVTDDIEILDDEEPEVTVTGETTFELTRLRRTRSHTFTITNTGNVDLVLEDLTVSGANSSEFTVTTAPASTTLAPSASTTFVVTFRPTYDQYRSATINIPSNTMTSPYQLAVNGTGLYFYDKGCGLLGIDSLLVLVACFLLGVVGMRVRRQ